MTLVGMPVELGGWFGRSRSADPTCELGRDLTEIFPANVSNPDDHPDVMVHARCVRNRSGRGGPPMKYMLLLTSDPTLAPSEGTPEFDDEMSRWGRLMGELAEAGVMVGVNGLDDESTATTVRVRDGETILTDGPYAETKEAFFSYYILDVEDLDAALEWAKKMPSVAYGSVEVRPLSPHSQA
jgi:hypothetical protein